MGKMKVRSTNPQAVEMANAALQPGERLLGVSDFQNRSGGARLPVTLCASNSMFRVSGYRDSRKGRRYTTHNVHPLASVASVSDRVMRSLGAADSQILVVSTANGFSYRFECNHLDATEFVAALKSAFNAAGRSGSVADELERLSKLAEDGVLEPEEWDRAKALYLGSPESSREQTVRMLGDLYGMMNAGVLSESEFRMKKWDILSRPS
jgi:hypothetical protein